MDKLGNQSMKNERKLLRILNSFIESDALFLYNGLERNFFYSKGIKIFIKECNALTLINSIFKSIENLDVLKIKETLTIHLIRNKSIIKVTFHNEEGIIVYEDTVCLRDYPLSKFQLCFENNTLYLSIENQ